MHFSECGGINCSATFQLSPNHSELGVLVVSVVAVDRLFQHNSTVLTVEYLVGKKLLCYPRFILF